jgi:putative phage-type endonuclease
LPVLTVESDIIRASNIAASEVGALIDEHPYSSRAKIYDRLTDPHPEPIARTEAMELGTFFEPYIARWVAHKYGLSLRANNRTRVHPRLMLCATPDYFVVGERMLVECKLSSKQYVWAEETMQPYVEWQARAQMAVTDRNVCIVAALVGSAFYAVPIVRDAAKEELLETAVLTFVRDHLIPGVRPDEVDRHKVGKVAIG